MNRTYFAHAKTGLRADNCHFRSLDKMFVFCVSITEIEGM